VEEIFFFNKLIAAGCCLPVLFLQRRSSLLLLKKTRSKLRTVWIGAGFCLLTLLLTAEAGSAADCDVDNNPDPFIEHDLTATGNTSVSCCELCGYGYITIIISNPHDRIDMFAMTAAENLGGSTLTFTSAQVPALNLLENRQGNNQSNTINALGANNIVLSGGSLCLVASNNIVDFIVTGDFAICTSNCPWGDTYERYANTSVYLGGKIWKCGS
jgi:hypothetical protein